MMYLLLPCSAWPDCLMEVEPLREPRAPDGAPDFSAATWQCHFLHLSEYQHEDAGLIARLRRVRVILENSTSLQFQGSQSYLRKDFSLLSGSFRVATQLACLRHVCLLRDGQHKLGDVWLPLATSFAARFSTLCGTSLSSRFTSFRCRQSSAEPRTHGIFVPRLQ